MKRFFLTLPTASSLFIVLLVAGYAQQGTAPAARATLTAVEQQAAAQVSIGTLREVTEKLAAPEMEGRGTAQRGADKAANYIADLFAKAGLQPGGERGKWLQPIRFNIETAQPDSAFRAGDTSFRFKEDFLLAPPFPSAARDISGELVLAGYGVTSEQLKRDDLAGIEVKGKIVILFGGRPKDVPAAVWVKEAAQQTVLSRLISKGAAGIVMTFAGRDTQPFSLIAEYLTRRRVSLVEKLPASAGVPPVPDKVLPAVIISDGTAEKIFAAAGMNFAELQQKAEKGEYISKSLPLRATISARVKREQGTSANVIGVLPGSDPQLKSEAVVYTAHYDAYGISRDGTIYPGAGDNALGTAKLVAIAEVMAKMNPKPRRTMIFVALTGEEYGLLGAEHWVIHPTWPIEKVAANINYDGISTDAWGSLGFLINLGFDHSELGGMIKEISVAHNVNILPDPSPTEGFFYRSDHYSFFKRGVPGLYLVGGPQGNPLEMMKQVNEWLVKHYHMPTDTVQPDWNWEGVRTLTSIGLVAGLRIAERDSPPAWTKDSPFNRPRGTTLPPPPRQ